jgi:hypothetical protein
VLKNLNFSSTRECQLQEAGCRGAKLYHSYLRKMKSHTVCDPVYSMQTSHVMHSARAHVRMLAAYLRNMDTCGMHHITSLMIICIQMVLMIPSMIAKVIQIDSYRTHRHHVLYMHI